MKLNSVIYLVLSCALSHSIFASDGDTKECDSFESVQSFDLQKSGFHRELEIDLHNFTPEVGSNIIVFVLNVPSGMYIDPYQVQSIKNIHFSMNFSVDVELPESKSTPSVVYACTLVEESKVHIKFPIHVRYHSPQYCYGNSLTVKNYLPKVHVYVPVKKHLDCKQGIIDLKLKLVSNADCSWIVVKDAREKSCPNCPQMGNLWYEIPVGCKEHTWTVLLGTVSSFLVGFSWIVYTVWNLTSKSKLQ